MTVIYIGVGGKAGRLGGKARGKADKLRSCDGLVRAEGSVCVALNVAAGSHGGGSLVVPHGAVYVAEAVFARENLVAARAGKQAVEDGRDLCARDRPVGANRAVRVTVDVGDVVVRVEAEQRDRSDGKRRGKRVVIAVRGPLRGKVQRRCDDDCLARLIERSVIGFPAGKAIILLVRRRLDERIVAADNDPLIIISILSSAAAVQVICDCVAGKWCKCRQRCLSKKSLA